MTRAFEDAEITAAEVAVLKPEMTNEPADRHVRAAAVAYDAELIVTFNLRHFPAAACEPYGIDAVHPDAFICDMYERAPARIRDALERQAADLSRPPMTVDDVLDRVHPRVRVRRTSQRRAASSLRHGSHMEASSRPTRLV
jgi:hypothetical protein